MERRCPVPVSAEVNQVSDVIATLQRLESRFWSKVQKTDGCWLWTGYKMRNGYGTIRVGSNTDGTRRKMLVHRVAWMLTNGNLPPNDCLCHRCDNPACVNPCHLFVGSRIENNADRDNKGRTPNGEAHGMSKLSNEDVVNIRRSTSPPADLALHYNVTRAHIYAVRARRYRKVN
jgi:hypothetical protein